MVNFSYKNFLHLTFFHLKSKGKEPMPRKKSDKEVEDFDQKLQAVMSKLRLKAELKRMAAFERGFGWAIIAADYIDEGDSAASSVPSKAIRINSG